MQHVTQTHRNQPSMKRPSGCRRATWRWATPLVAIALAVLLAGCGGMATGGGSSSAPATTLPLSTNFHVTSIALAVTPTSIGGKACGSSASFTYTATFHLPAYTIGGVIQFVYSLNNGRSQTPGMVTVGANQTSTCLLYTSPSPRD